MSDRKEKILLAALELFAREGYKGTSTSKIARHAGVSEGLIFRHYGNKEGLLAAILQQGEDSIRSLYADIVLEPDPKTMIRKTLEMCQNMLKTEADFSFWKLQYKMKWETEHYNEAKLEPLQVALTNAFSKLGYKSPEMEARQFLLHLDGIAMRLFLTDNFDLEASNRFLYERYGL